MNLYEFILLKNDSSLPIRTHRCEEHALDTSRYALARGILYAVSLNRAFDPLIAVSFSRMSSISVYLCERYSNSCITRSSNRDTWQSLALAASTNTETAVHARTVFDYPDAEYYSAIIGNVATATVASPQLLECLPST